MNHSRQSHQPNGRHSVDVRYNPSHKHLYHLRNSSSSQSNRKKNSKYPKSNSIKITKKKGSNIQSSCICRTAPLKDLFSTIVKLQKQKSVFGSNLQQLSRITKIVNELKSISVPLSHKLLKVIVNQQLSQVFPEVGRLVDSVIKVLCDPKPEESISKIIIDDIRKLENQLQDLKKQEEEMKNSFEQGSKIKQSRSRIQQLLETVQLQNLQLQKLRKNGKVDLEDTKQKLSNFRYK